MYQKKCYCTAALNAAGACPYGCPPKLRCPGKRARSAAKRARDSAQPEKRLSLSSEEKHRVKENVARMDPASSYKSLRRWGKI